VADRNSGTPAATRRTASRQSAREEVGRNPGPGYRERTLKGLNPREPPAVEVLNPPSVAKGLPGGSTQKPWPAGPAVYDRRWFHLWEERSVGLADTETFGGLAEGESSEG